MNAATQTAEVTNLPVVARRAEVRVVEDVIPVLDTARFEHMQRIAERDGLRLADPGRAQGPDLETTQANCFLVVNQAVRWNMDPFAVAQCVSVINGKILHEGKLIAAVIEQKLGIRLKAEWSGEGEKMSIKVSGMIDGAVETIEGSVADWKTTRDGSPWIPKQYQKNALVSRRSRVVPVLCVRPDPRRLLARRNGRPRRRRPRSPRERRRGA
jgi:hypothetical protein